MDQDAHDRDKPMLNDRDKAELANAERSIEEMLRMVNLITLNLNILNDTIQAIRNPKKTQLRRVSDWPML